MTFKTLFLSTIFTFCALSVTLAQSAVGVWKTVDDATGEAKSHIQIYEQDGKLYGKVIKFLRANADPNTVCDDCKGAKKGQKVMGMVIVEDLEPYKDYWKDGTILDPENGKEYGCSIWFEKEGNTDELSVRGKHWTGLYRTQLWYRVQ